MGNCCIRNLPGKNEGVFVNLGQRLSSTYEEDEILTHDDIKIILRRIIYSEYNERLADKRKLQYQRKKLLNKEIGEEYIKLIEESKKLELDVHKEVEEKALKDLKVNRENYESAISSIDLHSIKEMITKELLNEIKLNKKKLGMDKESIAELKKKYKSVYDECYKKIIATPDIARRLYDLYEDDLYLNHIDIVTTDTLYNSFKLLPLEAQAFIIEDC